MNRKYLIACISAAVAVALIVGVLVYTYNVKTTKSEKQVVAENEEDAVGSPAVLVNNLGVNSADTKSNVADLKDTNSSDLNDSGDGSTIRGAAGSDAGSASSKKSNNQSVKSQGVGELGIITPDGVVTDANALVNSDNLGNGGSVTFTTSDSGSSAAGISNSNDAGSQGNSSITVNNTVNNTGSEIKNNNSGSTASQSNSSQGNTNNSNTSHNSEEGVQNNNSTNNSAENKDNGSSNTNNNNSSDGNTAPTIGDYVEDRTITESPESSYDAGKGKVYETERIPVR